MQVTLAQAGIVAGIMTLAWVVGGPKEVYSAHSAPVGNYPYYVFNSTSKAHAEKVASLVPDSIVGSRGPRGKETWIVKSKIPSHEARSYFQPWLKENDYFRSNQFLSEVKYEAESTDAEKGHRRWVVGEGYSGRAKCKVCGEVIPKGVPTIDYHSTGGIMSIHSRPEHCGVKRAESQQVFTFKQLSDKAQMRAIKDYLEGWADGKGIDMDDDDMLTEQDAYSALMYDYEDTEYDRYSEDGVMVLAAESWEMIECGNCDATFTIDEGLDIGGIDYCEECYDTISAKEAESLGKDSCCCGATKDSPCDCMVTGSDCNQDCACATPSCPLCDEKIDFVDAYEEPMNYDLCDGCEEAVQEKRYDHAHSAESKKLNPIEKPIISGAASGATIEGLEDLMMSEWVDEHGFRWHLVSQDYAATHWRDEEIFWIDEADGTESLIDEDTYEAYLSPDWADEKFGKELGWNLHEPMSTMMSEGYTGHYSGGPYEECWDMLFFERADAGDVQMVDRMEEIENEVLGKSSSQLEEEKEAEDSQEELAELRTKLSKQRTAMSAMRTALAFMGLILAYDTYRDHKKSR